MYLSTIGLAVHIFLPSKPTKQQNKDVGQEQQAPNIETGNTYSLFTIKNYRTNAMHWFWMIVNSVLFLHVWWKVRKHLSYRDQATRSKKNSS